MRPSYVFFVEGGTNEREKTPSLNILQERQCFRPSTNYWTQEIGVRYLHRIGRLAALKLARYSTIGTQKISDFGPQQIDARSVLRYVTINKKTLYFIY